MDGITVTIGNVLEEKDISIYRLAQETSISYQTLHKLINNKTTSISFDVMGKIAQYLDCSFDELFKRKD